MKGFTKRGLSIFTALAMVLSLAVSIPGYRASADGKDVVVLYTNDIHCTIEDSDTTDDKNVIGYDGIAAYKKELINAGNYVTLVDAGDSIQGGLIGTISKGEYIIDIMNKVGYDLATPGNHEFDYGMDRFFELTDKASFKYLSCNFTDLTKNEPALEPYTIVDYGDKRIAYVGISTPESITKSTPTHFQDAEGNYIYGFQQGNNGQDLYDYVQATVDKAIGSGADYVIALAHLGVDEQSSPWTSREVIANTKGIDVVLDGHSHSTIEKEMVENSVGHEVLLTSTGTASDAIGQLTLGNDGTLTTKLVKDYTSKDPETRAYIDSIKEEYEEMLQTVVAKTDFDLVTTDPDTGKRIVRNRETNLGDLCADAYRTLLGADIAFVNGGGIRANIDKGDITYEEIINVHPFGNMACLIEATGQQILDALELGAISNPGESGGFLQVSGLTYEIHNYIPSSVKLDDNRMFVSVDGEYRVKNVMVGGEPLDLTKTYTLASHNYMLKSAGDGYSMFKGDKVLQDEVLIDNQVLINYIKDELKGVVGEEYSNPYGQGRIDIKTEAPAIVVDKATLQEEVDGAEELDKELYTSESYKACEAALTAAKEVLENSEATQEEVDQALTDLQEAKAALVEATAEEDSKEDPKEDSKENQKEDPKEEVVTPDSESKTDNSPKTGDTFNPALYGILGIAAAGAVVFLSKKGKKKGA